MFKKIHINNLIIISVIILFLSSLAWGVEKNNPKLTPEILQAQYYKRIKSSIKNNWQLKCELAGSKAKLIQLKIPIPCENLNTDNNNSPLTKYLDMVKKYFPGAEVTGMFHEWRSVSKYRVKAGLHYGYDIYMEKGTNVPAGWPGTVIAITQWYGEEYGVTLLLNNDITVTYGHVKPKVYTGQNVATGDIIAVCWSDHVDIKMRDREGNFLDFDKPLPVSEQNFSFKISKNQILNTEDNIMFLQSLIHLNIVRSHIDYLESQFNYYNLSLYNLSLQSQYLKNKLKNVKNQEEKNSIKDEINYLNILKERIAENILQSKKNAPDNIYFIEQNLKKAITFDKKITGTNNSIKLKLAASRDDIISLSDKCKKIKKSLGISSGVKEGKNLITFPPVYLSSDIKWNVKENNTLLKEAKRDLLGALNLYVQGLISYEKLNKYKENYKKALIKARLNIK